MVNIICWIKQAAGWQAFANITRMITWSSRLECEEMLDLRTKSRIGALLLMTVSGAFHVNLHNFSFPLSNKKKSEYNCFISFFTYFFKPEITKQRTVSLLNACFAND